MTLDQGRLIREGRQINLQLDLLVNRTLATADITGVQAQTLLYILRHARIGVSVTTLHRTTGHSKATISYLIKRLREKDYVRTESCQKDNRRKLLFATKKGQQLQGFLEESIQDAQNALYQDFSLQELSTLDRLQQKMLQNLSIYQTCIQKEVSTT